MSAPRHSWGQPSRFPHKTERVCARCDLCKVTRHEPFRSWIEWWRDGERIKADRTPACVAVEDAAEARAA